MFISQADPHCADCAGLFANCFCEDLDDCANYGCTDVGACTDGCGMQMIYDRIFLKNMRRGGLMALRGLGSSAGRRPGTDTLLSQLPATKYWGVG